MKLFYNNRITWGIAEIKEFYIGKGGLSFLITILFNFQLIAFSYFFSFAFSSPKSCIAFMPIIVILLIICPNIILIIFSQIAQAAGYNPPDSVWGKNLYSLYLYKILIYIK